MSFALGTHAPIVTGGGAISRILLRSRGMPERNLSNLSADFSGLRPWSRSLVPSMTISRSVSVGKAGAADGNLPAILAHVGDYPSGCRSQDVHPPAVRIIAPTEIASGIISVGVGITEADDFHPAHFLPLLIILSEPLIIFSLLLITNPIHFLPFF